MKGEGSMSLEKNKAIIRGMIEVFNKHNVALLDEFIAPDFVDERNTPFELRGLENFKKFETNFIKGFPDYHDAIEDIIAEGDKVCVFLNVTATHTGEWNFLGITLPPTGKKITYTAVNIWRIVNGKVVERKSVRDLSGFLTQLGVIELTEKAKKLFPENVR
jgi:predicted ester cyclase